MKIYQQVGSIATGIWGDAARQARRDRQIELFGEPEGENGVGDVGVIDVWAAEGVISVDGFSELFGASAFGKKGDEGIGVILAVPFHSGEFTWPVTDDVIPNETFICLA